MSDRFITSRLLPVTHGFSIRSGGISEGPYASLNLGFGVGDFPERVGRNLRLLSEEAGLGGEPFATVSQVHGDRVLRAESRDGAALGEADALWTDVPGLAVGIRTADCVPILIVDPEGRRVAAVHSGWRGTDARISARAVEALVAGGADPAKLLCAVGPAIGPCCYEVSSDLGDRFFAQFGAGAVRISRGRPYLDLASAVRDTLLGAGVQSAHIDILPLCTACDAARFFSHRRDGGVTGRHLSFVAAP